MASFIYFQSIWASRSIKKKWIKWLFGFRLLESLVATFVLLQLAVCWNWRLLVVAHQTYQTYNTQNAKSINLGQQFSVWGKHTFCTQNLSFLGRLIGQHKDRPPPRHVLTTGKYLLLKLRSSRVFADICFFVCKARSCASCYSLLLHFWLVQFQVLSLFLGRANWGTEPGSDVASMSGPWGLGHVWRLRFSENHEQTWRDEGPSGPSVMKQRNSCSCPLRINNFIWGAGGRKIDRLLLELNPLN